MRTWCSNRSGSFTVPDCDCETAYNLFSVAHFVAEPRVFRAVYRTSLTINALAQLSTLPPPSAFSRFIRLFNTPSTRAHATAEGLVLWLAQSYGGKQAPRANPSSGSYSEYLVSFDLVVIGALHLLARPLLQRASLKELIDLLSRRPYHLVLQSTQYSTHAAVPRAWKSFACSQQERVQIWRLACGCFFSCVSLLDYGKTALQENPCLSRPHASNRSLGLLASSKGYTQAPTESQQKKPWLFPQDVRVFAVGSQICPPAVGTHFLDRISVQSRQ